MTIELTYNQLKAPKRTWLDRAADFYWRHEEKLCAAMFIAVMGGVVASLVAIA